jgi:hypothetical protein
MAQRKTLTLDQIELLRWVEAGWLESRGVV